MPRFIYALVVRTLIAALGVRSGIAADKSPKVTLVYDHALPNVPGKSMKGALVEYGPGGRKGTVNAARKIRPRASSSKY